MKFDVNEQPRIPLLNNKALNIDNKSEHFKTKMNVQSLNFKICKNCDCESYVMGKNQPKRVLIIPHKNPLSRNIFVQNNNGQFVVKEVNVECRVAGDEISHHILVCINWQVRKYKNIRII